MSPQAFQKWLPAKYFLTISKKQEMKTEMLKLSWKIWVDV